MEFLEPSDVEQAFIDELNVFYTNQAGTTLPKELPSVFFRVLAVGGNQTNLVTDDWLVTIESFAILESQALRNANRAIAIVQAAARTGALGDEVCYGVRVATLPQNYGLPSVPSHKRYITTLSPSLRRRVVSL